MTNKLKRPQKIKQIPNCPECNVPLGDYQSSGAIICPDDVCRVGRFSTQ